MRKTKKQRFRASILAFLLIASMVLGMAPGSAGQVYAKESTSQTSSEEEPGFIDKAVGFLKAKGEKITSFFGAGNEAQPAAAYDTKKEADPDTLQTWQPLAKDTTENIGRIWTDKTVSTKDMEFEGTSHKGEIGDSQFLVALSALSSTSNTVTTSSKPLDIVLVLDVSGSMGDPLNYDYTPTYDIRENRRTIYYAQTSDGKYVKVDRITRDDKFLRWEVNDKSVVPKEDENDTTAGRIQFYTRAAAGSKMAALKTAANNFLTETAKQNDSISDPNKRHKISVVKFAGEKSTDYGNNTYDEERNTYNYSQRLHQLTAYTSQTISPLTNMIDSIKEGGATSADYGMQLAQRELNMKGRQDAQQVIIFFTDGEPNHYNSFDSDVANDAISASKELKAKKAIVYSIGVFADADPDNTSTSSSNQFNAYMHGISSNYPAATAWNTLGTAAEERKYYKAASDADQLNQIFEDILTDVNTGSGFPTEITQGYEPNEGGYVTFDDQLGAYMQVDAFKSILFANKKFDLDPDTGVKTEGNVTTYNFEGKGGNDLYPNGNLHDIIITVTKSDNLAVGDQVKVQIPASMIPLRHFSVDTNADGETTMKVKETWPIRLLYGASMKPGVAETLQDGLDDSSVDQALKTYLEENQTKIDGKAAAFFYSNLYTGKPWQGHDRKTLGDTVASFDPAKGNIFYYFTENTPIYTDDKFMHPVKEAPVSGNTYYYKKVFWALEEGTPVKKTIAYPFASDNFNQASANWNVNEKNEVYIKAGSAKLTRVDSLTLSKNQNTTNTATEVINPQWDNVNNPQTLRVHLGNNGRVAMEVPGALEITKDATVAADKNLNEEEIVKDKQFKFNISIPEMEGKTVKAKKRNIQENIQGDAFDLSFDGQGKAEAVLKDNETLYIYGLDAGVAYTVKEDIDSMAKGFALTSVDGKQKAEATGTIEAGVPKSHTFTNTYDVTGNLNGTDSLKVTKNFTGREGNQWLERDEFTFTLTAADDKATQDAIEANLIELPDPAEITINSNTEGKQAAFGNITFNIAGTFKFNVTEQESNIAGVTDDANRVREIVVNVVDNKDGTLKATKAEGSENLTFTNTYGAESGENNIAEQISATKKLTGRDMQADEFDFEVVTRKTPKYTGDFTPVVVATGTNAAAAEGAEGDVTFAGYDGNGKMNLVYTTESLNQAVTDGYAIKAVVDGKTVWTVNYTARELTNNLPEGVTSIVEKTAFDFTVVVTDNTDGTLIAEVQYPNGAITFENTYATGGTIVDTDPTDANAFFYKVLEGRDWLETDAFTFAIEPQDGAPAPIDAEGNPVTTVTVTKADLKDGKAPFGFGKIHFTDAHMEGATPNDDGTVSKTFTYDVTEVIPEDGAKIPGITYDGHTATLAITVTDNLQGELSATAVITTENGTFTNNYRSNLNYNAVGGLRISKVLNGRDMQKDQFTFRLTPKATEGSTTAKEAAQKLGFDEVKAYEFKNEAAAMGKATYMNVLSGKEVVFTQADAGKTYTYEIVEVKGQNEAYTYDEAVNIVTITVVDNNNGTLTVTTTVKKNGEVVDTKVVSTGDAEAAPATAPFVNVYNDVPESLGGEGSVAINATKSLTNRPMADREFTFHVTDKNEAQVATGNNDASGKITFTPIEYTTDKLNEDAEKGTATKSYDVEKDAYTYTYQYKVEEDLSNVDEGVTGIVTAFSIQVVVTDDGNGNLTIAVVYPDGKDTLPFENAYGTSAEAAIHVNGQKVLNVESGNNAPDITGKYIFTLSGSDGAPMPEKATANNDAAGNVDFGKIKYTMQNVFGDTGVTAEAEGTEEALTEVMPVSDTRTKTFTYTVTESGTVEGVTNDAESVKTFNVTVTDNGDGTIKVDKDYTGFEFGFTNTYHVEPVDFDINDAEAGITVKKELTGRAMNAGEFVFELISDKDKSVREAVNDTDGNVKFETMNFTAPGEYIYTLRERNTKLGGVDYDTTEYQVVVTVTDNGDGTMSAEAKLADEGKDVVFKNQYEAAPTSVMFGASKIYKGADLKDGQFTFVVKDADGNVVSEAKNNKDGMVTFDTIEFNEEGTYTFTISEKNDKQKNVTYDKAVYEVTVTVTDNGEGSLIAEVAYADGKAPVFTNKYTKPAKPAKPEEPKGPTAVKTGDEAPVIPFIILMVATLAIIVTITFIFFRRKRR